VLILKGICIYYLKNYLKCDLAVFQVIAAKCFLVNFIFAIQCDYFRIKINSARQLPIFRRPAVKFPRLHLGLRIPLLKRQVCVIHLCLSEGLKKNWVLYGENNFGISLLFYIAL